MGIEDVEQLQGDNPSSETNTEPTPPAEETAVETPPETPVGEPEAPAQDSQPSPPVDGPELTTAEQIVADREKFEIDQRNEADKSRAYRSDIELEYAQGVEKVHSEYTTALSDLKLGRDGKLSELAVQRQNALEEAGLNPSGSDPRRYPNDNPQGDFSA